MYKQVKKTPNTNFGDASRQERKKTAAAVIMTTKLRQPKIYRKAVDDNASSLRRPRRGKAKTAKVSETGDNLEESVNRKVAKMKAEAKIRKASTGAAKSKSRKSITIKDNVVDKTEKIKSKKKNTTKKARMTVIENESKTIPQSTDKINVTSRKRKSDESQRILAINMPNKKARRTTRQTEKMMLDNKPRGEIIKAARKFPANAQIYRPSTSGTSGKKYNQTATTQEKNLKISSKNLIETVGIAKQKKNTKKRKKGKRNAITEKTNHERIKKRNAAIKKRQIKKTSKKKEITETVVLQKKKNILTLIDEMSNAAGLLHDFKIMQNISKKNEDENAKSLVNEDENNDENENRNVDENVNSLENEDDDENENGDENANALENEDENKDKNEDKKTTFLENENENGDKNANSLENEYKNKDENENKNVDENTNSLENENENVDENANSLENEDENENENVDENANSLEYEDVNENENGDENANSLENEDDNNSHKVKESDYDFDNCDCNNCIQRVDSFESLTEILISKNYYCLKADNTATVFVNKKEDEDKNNDEN